MNRTKTFAISILSPILVGAVVGFITAPTMEYNSLVKPVLAPPGFIFPIVWTILYVLMGISYGILKNRNKITPEINFIYYMRTS